MNLQDFSDLTCIVPTHNRSPFLRRQLAYINAVNHFPQTLIVDSSNRELAVQNQKIIASTKGKAIEYLHQDIGFSDKIIAALNQLTSTYVVFCADDDTLSPYGLANCLKVLKEDPTSRGAIGRAYILNTASQRLSIARGHAITDTDPLARIRSLSKNWFSNFYAIHHRKLLLEQFTLSRQTVDMPESRLLNELLNSLLAIAAGPLLYVDCDYLAYQLHESNYSKTSSHFREPKDYPVLREKVINTLATYVSDKFPETSTRCLTEVQDTIHHFLRTQKLPDQRPSEIFRFARKIQRFYRTTVGVQRTSGWLETKRVPFDLDQIRCRELFEGMSQVINHTCGTSPAAEATLAKLAAA